MFGLCWRQRSLATSASTRLYSTAHNFTLFQKNDFKNLVTDLRTLLTPVTTQSQVDVKTTMNLLRLYQSEELHWSQYALRDPTKPYTRNFVSKPSPISELLVLVWEPGKVSKIHNHPGSNCFVKVLKGTLSENQYEKKDADGSRDLQLKTRFEVPTNAVTFINDDIALHQMENKTKEPVVTLHLYIPMYTHCVTYETGGNAVINNDLDFYSVEGKII